MSHAWQLEDNEDNEGTIADLVADYVAAHGETTAEELRGVFPAHAASITQAAHRAKQAGRLVNLGRGVYGPPEPAPDPKPAPVRGTHEQRESPRVRMVKAFQFFRRGVADGLVTQGEAEFGLWRSIERIICEEMA